MGDHVIPRFEEQADKVESLGGLEVGVEKGIISVRVQHGSGFSLVGDEIGARKGVIPTFQKITWCQSSAWVEVPMIHEVVGSGVSSTTQAAEIICLLVAMHAEPVEGNSSGTHTKWKRKARGGRKIPYGTTACKEGREKKG